MPQKRDAALLWLEKSVLENVRNTPTYQAAQLNRAIQLSGKEIEEEDAKRRAAWLERVPAEPPPRILASPNRECAACKLNITRSSPG